MNMIYIKKNDKHGSFELGKSSNRLRNWPASHVWLPEGICCTLLCCVFFESWEATCQKSEAIWLSLKIGYPNISFIYIYITCHILIYAIFMLDHNVPYQQLLELAVSLIFWETRWSSYWLYVSIYIYIIPQNIPVHSKFISPFLYSITIINQYNEITPFIISYYIIYPIIIHLYHSWLVVSTPLKNISQLGLLFPIYGKIKNVPNHQPDSLQWYSPVYSHCNLLTPCS